MSSGTVDILPSLQEGDSSREQLCRIIRQHIQQQKTPN